MTMIEKREKYFGLLRQARSRSITRVILFRKTFAPAQRFYAWLPFVFMLLSLVVIPFPECYWIIQLVILAGLCASLLIPRCILLRHDVTGSKTTKWPSMDDRLYSIIRSLLDKERDDIEDLLPLQEWLEASLLAKPKILINTIIVIVAYYFLPFFDAFVKELVESSFTLAFSRVVQFIGISIVLLWYSEVGEDRRRIARAELHRLISMYIAERKTHLEQSALKQK